MCLKLKCFNSTSNGDFCLDFNEKFLDLILTLKLQSGFIYFGQHLRQVYITRLWWSSYLLVPQIKNHLRSFELGLCSHCTGQVLLRFKSCSGTV